MSKLENFTLHQNKLLHDLLHSSAVLKTLCGDNGMWDAWGCVRAARFPTN